jgi:hypothetical protein
MEITCKSCSKRFPYPVEWLELNDTDKCYLEDDYCCQPCWVENEQESYYRAGMAELKGYGICLDY